MSSKSGFRGEGNYSNKLGFGIATSVIRTVSTGTTTTAEGEVYKNITVSGTGTLLSNMGAGGKVNKIIANDTVSVLDSGNINCNGGEYWASNLYSPGFKTGDSAEAGSLGGSGDSGAAGANGAGGLPIPGFGETARRWLGGNGGDGGLLDGYSGTPGPGGVIYGVVDDSLPSIFLNGIVYDKTTALESDLLFPFKICGGAGGGGVAGFPGGGGFSSGGGGCGGGVCWVAANRIIVDGGSITAHGQATEGGYGGGGGGGGAVILICSELTITNGGVIAAQGGNGGGLGAENGSDGYVYVFSGDTFSRFSGILTEDIYKAAIVSGRSKGGAWI